MNGIQSLSPIKTVTKIQNSYSNKRITKQINPNRQINNVLQNKTPIVKIQHENEDNNQITYNSQGQKQPVTDAVSTFEGVA